MAGSPKLKLYNPQGEYVASFKHGEDAAALASIYGTGTTIRDGHTFVVWREGHEEFGAGESYDRVASVILGRLEARYAAARERYHGGRL